MFLMYFRGLYCIELKGSNVILKHCDATILTMLHSEQSTSVYRKMCVIRTVLFAVAVKSAVDLTCLYTQQMKLKVIL